MDSLQPGDPASVGGYRLLGRLGSGGMGQVFLGVSPGGRKVAVKLIHPFYAETAQFRARFAREIKAARRVGGFHTAPVVDADPQADPPWMVTAYIEGPSLQEDVDQAGPLPAAGVRALGAGLAEGMAAIHASGLVHRDLKPGNVILAADGPRIIDFGVARAVDGTAGLTTAGAVVGTFAYMSPEQVRGEVAGQASDVFSLGAVLAFAATGRPPFGADLAYTVMFRITGQPPDLAGLADRDLTGLIEACLAKTPEARPAIRDLLAALGGRQTATVCDVSGHAAARGPGSQAGRKTQPGREVLLAGAGTPAGRAGERAALASPGFAAPQEHEPETWPGREAPRDIPHGHEPETQPEHAAPPGAALGQAAPPGTGLGYTAPPGAALGYAMLPDVPRGHEPETRPERAAQPGAPVAHEPETRPERVAPTAVMLEREVAPVRARVASRTGPPMPGGAAAGRPTRGRRRRWAIALAVAVVLAAALAIAVPILLHSGPPKAAGNRRPVTEVRADSATATPARGRPSPASTRHSPTPRPTPSRTAAAGSAEPQLLYVPDVIGDTVTSATKILEDAGFEVKVDRFGPAVGKVFDYAPVGKAAPGSTITIDVGGF